jgi:DNA-binding PadR family transcriptional regulator
MLAGMPSHGYIDSSQIESLGGGKANVSNAAILLYLALLCELHLRSQLERFD